MELSGQLLQLLTDFSDQRTVAVFFVPGPQLRIDLVHRDFALVMAYDRLAVRGSRSPGGQLVQRRIHKHEVGD